MTTTQVSSDPFARDVVAVCGIPFDRMDLAAATTRLADAATKNERLWLSTVNLDWVVMAREDPAFYATILRSDLVTCDGAPLVKLTQLIGEPLPGRVTGADLFEHLRARSGEPLSTYFFGGRDNAAELATKALGENPVGLRPAGGVNPGFGDLASLSEPHHIDAVNTADPQFLIVALGAKKGQMWLDRNLDRLTAPVVAHLGAVVDFAAGGIKRAPDLAQSLHLEWAWRIGQDRALWRRYAHDAGLLPHLIKEAITTRRALAALAKKPSRPAQADNQNGVLALDGDHSDRDLTALRTTLRTMDAPSNDIRIEVASACRLGLSSVGLLLIATQKWRDQGKSVTVFADDRECRRLLHVNRLPLSSGLNQTSVAAARAPSIAETSP